jgi:hypothetical protein
VVPLPAGDSRGLVLPSALLPLTICGVIMAAVIGLVLAFRPAWRQIMALVVVSATAGLGAYLIAQGLLGALPHHAVATWAVLSLILLAIGSATAGPIALIGAGGLGLSILAMIFVGNPFSRATSAPELLPANLLRSTAYFGGHGAGVTSRSWSSGSRRAWRRSPSATTPRCGSPPAGPPSPRRGSGRTRRCGTLRTQTGRTQTGRTHRKLFGQIIVRHMCATGEPSKPSPSAGWRKCLPTTSSNSSKVTTTAGSKE